MPRTTAHTLAEAACQSPPQLPADEETVRDFGLDKVTATNWLVILEFWKIVFQDFGVHPADVDKWRREGKLVRKLDKMFTEDEGWVARMDNKDFTRRFAACSLFFWRNKELFESEGEAPGDKSCNAM